MADACHFENVYVIWYISGNKTTNINAKKTVVYLQLIPATWHIENSKNDERWYYFRSTLTFVKYCFSSTVWYSITDFLWSLMAVLLFCCPTALLQLYGWCFWCSLTLHIILGYENWSGMFLSKWVFQFSLFDKRTRIHAINISSFTSFHIMNSLTNNFSIEIIIINNWKTAICLTHIAVFCFSIPWLWIHYCMCTLSKNNHKISQLWYRDKHSYQPVDKYLYTQIWNASISKNLFYSYGVMLHEGH